MLKFFRKYNKQILVVGGVLLMVVFLIQPAMSIFMPTGAGRVVATIDGRDVTAGQRQRAAAEMEMLGRVHPIFSYDLGDEPLVWLALQRRAAELGLSASEGEVAQLISTLQVGDAQLDRVTRGMRTTREAVYATLRKYLAAARYRQLAAGAVEAHPIDRLAMLFQAIQLAQRVRQIQQQLPPWQAFQLTQRVQQAFAMAEGRQRLSRPALDHAVRDTAARVGGRLVTVDARDRVDEDHPPSDNELASLFEQYKDDYPGEGEPYGFGYRIPDRVRVEWLQFTRADVAATITVDEAEAVAYYRENEDRFPVEPPAEGEDGETTDPPEPVGPYPSRDVRQRVIEALRNERATEKLERMAAAARNLMRQPLRPLEEDNGYKVIPAGFETPDLADVAEQIHENYGVRPMVRRARESWTSLRSIDALGGLAGTAMVDRDPPVTFREYVASARELDPAPDNPLAPLRLQVHAPSEPMRDFANRNWFVFRLTDAEAGHVPESLDAVRNAVVRDARLLRAYRGLTDALSGFTMTARADGLDALAESTAATVRDVPPRSRLAARRGDDQLVNNPNLLAAMFELAADVGGRADLADLTRAEKVTSVELPGRLAVGVFELTEYRPVTRQNFNELLDQTGIASQVGMLLDSDRRRESGPWLYQLPLGEAIQVQGNDAADTPAGPNPSPDRPTGVPGRPTGL